MSRKRTRAQLYLEDRANGMTYTQIAEKHGVSRQRVSQVCGTRKESQFRIITPEGCIFVNLRNWMNNNRISRMELIRRMGMQPGGRMSSRMTTYLTGRSDPPKYIIDSMIGVTGLNYEALFEIG